VSSTEDTPVEIPTATLSANRPIVMAVLNAATALRGTCDRLAAIGHDVRVATEPVASATLHRLADAFAEIKTIGETAEKEIRP